jgi:hypothetical protein
MAVIMAADLTAAAQERLQQGLQELQQQPRCMMMKACLHVA